MPFLMRSFCRTKKKKENKFRTKTVGFCEMMNANDGDAKFSLRSVLLWNQRLILDAPAGNHNAEEMKWGHFICSI